MIYYMPHEGYTPRFFKSSAVLGIRDILVQIRIPGSVRLTNGSGFNYFLQRRMQNNYLLHIFLMKYTQAHYLQSYCQNFV
jgi:hypothetical protein